LNRYIVKSANHRQININNEDVRDFEVRIGCTHDEDRIVCVFPWLSQRNATALAPSPVPALPLRFAPVAVPPVIRAELFVDFFSEIDGFTRLFNLHDKF
jgi:hypothetical protein